MLLAFYQPTPIKCSNKVFDVAASKPKQVVNILGILGSINATIVLKEYFSTKKNTIEPAMLGLLGRFT